MVKNVRYHKENYRHVQQQSDKHLGFLLMQKRHATPTFSMTNSRLDFWNRETQIVMKLHIKSGELPPASIIVNKFDGSRTPVANMFTI